MRERDRYSAAVQFPIHLTLMLVKGLEHWSSLDLLFLLVALVSVSNSSLTPFLPYPEVHFLGWAPWSPPPSACNYAMLPLEAASSFWPQPHRLNSSTSFSVAVSSAVPNCYCTSPCAVETPGNASSQAEGTPWWIPCALGSYLWWWE